MRRLPAGKGASAATEALERAERYRAHEVEGYPFVYRDLPGALVRRLQQRVALTLTTEFEASGSDLTPVQYTVLAAVCTHPKSEQGEIADLVGYDRATVGGVVDRLEKKGLVTRSLSERDRRVRLLTVSATGKALLKKLSDAILRAQDAILAPLGSGEREALQRLLAKLVPARPPR
jgi:DNA-binding MarR family transcriptional regulator